MIEKREKVPDKIKRLDLIPLSPLFRIMEREQKQRNSATTISVFRASTNGNTIRDFTCSLYYFPIIPFDQDIYYMAA